ncbi:MAG: histidine-type phosphatase [Bacteroidales bacterium]|nr:histidine-type phosphatase [Bacteroidales bacterium]
MKKIFSLLFFSLAALSVQAQTSREEVCANLDKAGGVYLVYPEPTEALTPAPKGYAPFYISHYARHGSRYLISDRDYGWVMTLLEKAQKQQALSAFGQEVLERLHNIWPLVEGRGGDLTPKGVRQHQGIAERMYRNFPAVFKGDRSVSARSTVVLRCAMSMTAFGDQLKGLAPNLSISYEASEKYMNYLNYHADEANLFTHRQNGPWVCEYQKFARERLHPERMVSALFSSQDFIRRNVNEIDLMWGFYWIAVDMQDIDTDIRFYDVFTPDEMFELWQCNSYCFYASDANHTGSRGLTVGNAKNLLRNIVESADEAIADNSKAATFRFGHDGNVIPLLAILGIEDFNVELSGPEKAYEKWADFKAAPMAANVQIVFFRNKANHVIVKVLHNEREVHIPVKTDNFPYYNWTDVRDFYLSILQK